MVGVIVMNKDFGKFAKFKGLGADSSYYSQENLSQGGRSKASDKQQKQSASRALSRNGNQTNHEFSFETCQAKAS